MADDALVPIAWRSKIYPRFYLTLEDITRLMDRYLTPGYLTKEELNHELHKAECWLRDNPGRARHKRDWYRYANNWFAKEEDKARNRKLRKTGSNSVDRSVNRQWRDERRRALGLE